MPVPGVFFQIYIYLQLCVINYVSYTNIGWSILKKLAKGFSSCCLGTNKYCASPWASFITYNSIRAILIDWQIRKSHNLQLIARNFISFIKKMYRFHTYCITNEHNSILKQKSVFFSRLSETSSFFFYILHNPLPSTLFINPKIFSST